MGIGLIIVAVSAGLAILYSALNAGNIAPAVIDPIMAPFIAIVNKFFFFLASISPFLFAVIPLYILRKRDEKALSMGILYGVALLAIILGLGLDVHLVDLFKTSWYGSTITTAGSILGTLGEGLGVLFFGISVWIWGTTLAIVDIAMGGISFLGDAAYDNRYRIKRERKRLYKKQEERM